MNKSIIIAHVLCFIAVLAILSVGPFYTAYSSEIHVDLVTHPRCTLTEFRDRLTRYARLLRQFAEDCQGVSCNGDHYSLRFSADEKAPHYKLIPGMSRLLTVSRKHADHLNGPDEDNKGVRLADMQLRIDSLIGSGRTRTASGLLLCTFANTDGVVLPLLTKVSLSFRGSLCRGHLAELYLPCSLQVVPQINEQRRIARRNRYYDDIPENHDPHANDGVGGAQATRNRGATYSDRAQHHPTSGFQQERNGDAGALGTFFEGTERSTAPQERENSETVSGSSAGQKQHPSTLQHSVASGEPPASYPPPLLTTKTEDPAIVPGIVTTRQDTNSSNYWPIQEIETLSGDVFGPGQRTFESDTDDPSFQGETLLDSRYDYNANGDTGIVVLEGTSMGPGRPQ